MSIRRYADLTEFRDKTLHGETGWTWPKTDFGAWNGPYEDWYFHKEHYFKYVKDNGVVITAGANMGMYSRFYAKMFRAVYAFEPDPLNFYCLVNNVQNDNVIKINAALGESPGFVQMVHLHETNMGEMQVKYDPSPRTIIPVMTIDSFEFPKVDFIQLDVERFEDQALKGALRTLDRCRPVISIEDTDNHLESFMNGLRYQRVADSAGDQVYIPAEWPVNP